MEILDKLPITLRTSSQQPIPGVDESEGNYGTTGLQGMARSPWLSTTLIDSFADTSYVKIWASPLNNIFPTPCKQIQRLVAVPEMSGV